MMKNLFNKLFKKSSKNNKVILVSSEQNQEIIDALKAEDEKMIATQMKEMRSSIYLLSSRVKDLTERVIELTTSVQEYHHDLDDNDHRDEEIQNLVKKYNDLNKSWFSAPSLKTNDLQKNTKAS
jgi:tRNA U34 5-carboxymethylaminomethyl modifying GTPase MnmE/TrmE